MSIAARTLRFRAQRATTVLVAQIRPEPAIRGLKRLKQRIPIGLVNYQEIAKISEDCMRA